MILDIAILHFKKDYNIITRRKVKKKKGHYQSKHGITLSKKGVQNGRGKVIALC